MTHTRYVQQRFLVTVHSSPYNTHIMYIMCEARGGVQWRAMHTSWMMIRTGTHTPLVRRQGPTAALTPPPRLVLVHGLVDDLINVVRSLVWRPPPTLGRSHAPLVHRLHAQRLVDVLQQRGPVQVRARW